MLVVGGLEIVMQLARSDDHVSMIVRFQYLACELDFSPALFIGHGNPLHALPKTVHSQTWRDMLCCRIDSLTKARA